MNLKFLIALLLIFSLNAHESISYPNFHDNPCLDDRMRAVIAPHLIPLDHPIRPTLDAIFFQTRAVENEKSLTDAGFNIIVTMGGSFVTVARHPAMPGYVFKLYFDSERRNKSEIPNWRWLARRCIGAKKIRDLIKKKKIRHFVVPDKWLYVFPAYPLSRELNPQPIMMIATDMELEPAKTTAGAWKKVKRKHLNELYTILKHGYGTTGLVRNIPYTKKGKFAFTDTEYPKRHFNLEQVNPYLSKKMQLYWDSLLEY